MPPEQESSQQTELLERIDANVAALLQWQAKMDERCSSRLQILQGHQRTLYGNDGLDGLVTQTNSNCDFIENAKAWQLKVFGGVVAAAIISVGAAILSLWKAS
jgi:hypothetical protein